MRFCLFPIDPFPTGTVALGATLILLLKAWSVALEIQIALLPLSPTLPTQLLSVIDNPIKMKQKEDKMTWALFSCRREEFSLRCICIAVCKS